MMKTISVVIPVFGEENNIRPMYDAMKHVIKDVAGTQWEILFVDDGSKDGTWSKVKALVDVDNNVGGVRFSRNFGKEAAIEAGLKRARGDAIIVIDGDLQHPPKLIPELINAWRNGNEVVCTRNITLRHPSVLKRLTSSLFYKMLNLSSDTRIEPGMSDFCLLSRRVADEINSLPEKDRFHRVLTQWIGFGSVVIPYRAEQRIAGESKYTIRRLMSLARSAILSSSTMPMTIILLIGCMLMVVGATITLGLLVYKYFIDWEYIGAASVLAAFIVLNDGILMIALGIMSMYQLSTYNEVKGRPSYIIRDDI